MRLPTKEDDYFATQVNLAFQIVKDTYFLSIKPQIEMRKVNAMLGDGSVAQVNSFEPQSVIEFYQLLIKSLKRWATTGISSSQTDDLHRLYCQFTLAVSRYKISSYFGIQFHALPYYRVDKRIIEIQKELTRIEEEGEKIFRSMASRGNHIVQKELESIGYTQIGLQELVAKLFEDEHLVTDLEKKVSVIENDFPEFKKINHKKKKLCSELNGSLMELCQISPVLLNYNQLMRGEEGIITYSNIEKLNAKDESDSYINTKRMTREVTAQIVNILNEVVDALHEVRHNIVK